MKISEKIGKNVEMLMNKEGMSLRDMAEIIGVTHPTMKKYIDGTQPIDSNKLLMVARYFNRPMDYFFKDHDGKEISNFLYRADSAEDNIENKNIQDFANTLSCYLDIFDKPDYSFIPQKYTLNIENSKKITENMERAIEKIAYEQRQFMNIETIIPENYYEIIENIGINVVSKDFGSTNLFGVSSFSPEYGSFILINDSEMIPEEKKIFSLFHEYAHLLFNQEQYSTDEASAFYKCGKTDINEMIANRFAGYFLLPRCLIREYIASRNNPVDLFEMKTYFKVSIQTLYLVLNKYKMISKQAYMDFWKELNISGYKKAEPSPMKPYDIEEKNIRLMSRMKELYGEENISANKISEILGLDTMETRQLLKKWRDADGRYLHLS